MTDLDKSLKMLKSRDPNVRYEACEELRLATESSPEIVLALEEATQDDNRLVVERAILALTADVHQQMGVKMGRYPAPPGAEHPPGELLSVQPNQPVGKRFGIRAAAYWIDFFIINTVLFSVSYGTGLIARGFIYVILHIFHISISVGTLADGWYWVLGIIAPILYFVIFEWLYGASPGKLILGMRVVQENGEPCSFGAALTRGLLRLVDLLFFGLLAYVNMKPPLQQRIGDKSAHTIVVAANDPVISRKLPAWRVVLAAGLVLGVWFVLSAVSLAFSVERIDHMAGSGAGDANLLVGDLGNEFEQIEEYSRDDFEDNSFLDASQRLFSSPDMGVDSMVIYLDIFPTDTDAAMQSSLDSIAKDYLGDVSQKVKDSEILTIGDRGWAKVYHNLQSGDDLVVAVVFYRNALVRVILYGDPDVATLEKAKSLEELIVERIRTGYQIPPTAEPMG